MTIHVFVQVAAVLCFVLAAFNVGHPKVNMIGAGLALWTGAALL